jgi:hypothetical protein
VSDIHGVTRKNEWLLLHGFSYMGDDPLFQRNKGMNLSDGRVHVGDVQSPEKLVVKAFTMCGPRTYAEEHHPGMIKGPIIFELERLFHRAIEQADLVGVLRDGVDSSVESFVRNQNRELQAWLDSYQGEIAASKIGKPVIEADFMRKLEMRARLPSERSYSVDAFRNTYGQRIFDLLQGAYGRVR